MKILSEKPKEFCGVFGVYNSRDAADMTYLGLYALQHRGQESAGIVSNKGMRLYSEKSMGLVNEVFTESELSKLKGDTAIGHVRYSTTGSSSTSNIQPLVVEHRGVPMAIAHNGNIPKADEIRKDLEEQGIIFTTETDSELILKMFAREKGTRYQRLIKVLNKLKGCFSLLILFPEEIIAVRDGYGVRPLSIGKKGDTLFFSSESCAFELAGAEFVRDVQPGEVVVKNRNGIKSLKLDPQELKPCIFELVYFSRPDSDVFSKSVYKSRINMGRELAKENKIDADMVMPVPDSANIQALGYSRESGIPLEFGLIRNHYIGRTFIEPHQEIRDLRAKIKHSPISDALKDKKVIIIDDSIVRGTTSKKLVSMIRKAGAEQVHLLISSPPIRFPCFYGIDTPTKKELIASDKKTKQIEKFLDVDSLSYLSLEGLLKACQSKDYCVACFTGGYPL